MYLELAEENLIQAGRRFRVAASGLQSNGDENSAGIKGRAKALTGWGAALSLRSELVLSSQGDVVDAESLVVAAVEKFKAAAAIEPDSPTIYVSWGDAMRMEPIRVHDPKVAHAPRVARALRHAAIHIFEVRPPWRRR